MITYEVFLGKEVAKFIPLISQMRIYEFRGYPYLYIGNTEYEKEYLTGFCNDPRSSLVLAKDSGTIIGLTTAMPLKSDANILKDLEEKFAESGLQPEKFYYFGEFIVLDAFRGRGLSRHMEESILNLAKEWGFTYSCLATVNRSHNDPRKPKSFASTDFIWSKMGYRKFDLVFSYSWPMLSQAGIISDQPNEQIFWKKQL